MWMALALRVFDETLTGFLYIYNPAVLELRARFRFWPMPTFAFEHWLGGLALLILLLAALSPFAFHNPRWIRPVCYLWPLFSGFLTRSGTPCAGIRLIANIAGRSCLPADPAQKNCEGG